ncbi:MAG: hypothetical protein PHR35_09555, partial [Kiritimatiellae bacterium]|nr:hypothetical protein [Kiritimatiellia bacterium]
MSPKPAQSAPLLRRSYLMALGAIAVVALPLVLLERGPRWWRQLCDYIAGPEAMVQMAPPPPMSDDTAKALQSMRTFLFELAEKGDDRLSRLPDCLKCGVTPCICNQLCAGCGSRNDQCTCAKCPGCGRKRGLCTCPRDPLGPDAPLARHIWDLPVHAITYERSGWVAWVGANRLVTGMQIGMSPNPAGNCGFRILSISRHCVWAWAVFTEEDAQARIPDIKWPDFVSVRVMQDGKANRPV